MRLAVARRGWNVIHVLQNAVPHLQSLHQRNQRCGKHYRCSCRANARKRAALGGAAPHGSGLNPCSLDKMDLTNLWNLVQGLTPAAALAQSDVAVALAPYGEQLVHILRFKVNGRSRAPVCPLPLALAGSRAVGAMIWDGSAPSRSPGKTPFTTPYTLTAGANCSAALPAALGAPASLRCPLHADGEHAFGPPDTPAAARARAMRQSARCSLAAWCRRPTARYCWTRSPTKSWCEGDGGGGSDRANASGHCRPTRWTGSAWAASSAPTGLHPRRLRRGASCRRPPRTHARDHAPHARGPPGDRRCCYLSTCGSTRCTVSSC